MSEILVLDSTDVYVWHCGRKYKLSELIDSDGFKGVSESLKGINKKIGEHESRLKALESLKENDHK